MHRFCQRLKLSKNNSVSHCRNRMPWTTSRIYLACSSAIFIHLIKQQTESRTPWYKLLLLCHRTAVYITFLCYESKYEEARSICFSRSIVAVFVDCPEHSIINMKKSPFDLLLMSRIKFRDKPIRTQYIDLFQATNARCNFRGNVAPRASTSSKLLQLHLVHTTLLNLIHYLIE